MAKDIYLLDCTLRDGAYVVNGNFGSSVIKGIINKLQDANIEIIECGWLKDNLYEDGSTYYHVPDDLKKYIDKKNENQIFVAMLDWDRYDFRNLPKCDGKTIDAVRIVFPYEKYRECMGIVEQIMDKGYKVYLQAANTLAYNNRDLSNLAMYVNKLNPVCLSIVDTFGAMYHEDLTRIADILDKELNPEIKIGFHSHNNQQLSFALTIHFISLLNNKRDIIVDSSLCGMGRGAGNATTELIVNYLNCKYNKNYNMNHIMDAIDTYIKYFMENNKKWGYSAAYFIAGMYCSHINNIEYLLKKR